MSQIPHNTEAERAVLGAIMQDPRRLHDVRSILSERDWYSPEHARLWRLLLVMEAAREPIDFVTLSGRIMGDDGWGLSVSYVAGLPEYAPSSANASHYARAVADRARARRLQRAMDEARECSTADEMHAAMQRALMADRGRAQDRKWRESAELREAAIVAAEARQQQRDKQGTAGVSTGYGALDEIVGGLLPGKLYIVAGRPAMGKSALAMGMAVNAANAARYGEVTGPVLVHNLEMPGVEVGWRIISERTGVPYQAMDQGQLAQRDWDIIARDDDSGDLHMIVDESAGLSMADIVSSAHFHAARRGALSCVVVDYLQLCRFGDPRQRVTHVGDAAQACKELAKDLSCPVVLLSQLNRGVEARQDKRPLMSDLRDSGAIEQAADVIMLVYRDAYYAQQEGRTVKDRQGRDVHPSVVEVQVAKQRGGATGLAELAFKEGRIVPDEVLT